MFDGITKDASCRAEDIRSMNVNDTKAKHKYMYVPCGTMREDLGQEIRGR